VTALGRQPSEGVAPSRAGCDLVHGPTAFHIRSRPSSPSSSGEFLADRVFFSNRAPRPTIPAIKPRPKWAKSTVRAIAATIISMRVASTSRPVPWRPSLRTGAGEVPHHGCEPLARGLQYVTSMTSRLSTRADRSRTTGPSLEPIHGECVINVARRRPIFPDSLVCDEAGACSSSTDQDGDGATASKALGL